MKIEKLNYGRNKKILLYGLILGAGLTIGTCFNTSMAKYKVTESIPIAKGKITNYKVPDLNVVAMYQQGDNGYQEINNVPTSGYTLSTSQSYCGIPDTNGNIVKDNTIPMEYKDEKIYIGVSKKRTKCYLYFEKKLENLNTGILANTPIGSGTPNFANTSCAIGCSETTNGLYTATDSEGTSYYFRGTVDNNWVKFGKEDGKDILWRIVRINGNGTIRLIYSGTGDIVTDANKKGETTQIQKSVYNIASDKSYYVGYTYTAGLQRPTTKNTGTSSTIKEVLENWYTNNLASYASKIDQSASYCNDRDIGKNSWVENSAGPGFFYITYNRVRTTYKPTLICNNDLDEYTTKIGLITADEVAYAGSKGTNNNSGFYLYTGQSYWTMSPFSHTYGDTNVSLVTSTGGNGNISVKNSYGVRPVINLRADTQFSGGNGTADNPYVVE